jgi:NAD(P)H-hydrate epimerase
MAQRWQQAGGAVHPFHPDLLQSHSLLLDAVFGIGLNRPLEPEILALFQHISDSGLPVIAADIPSGLDADSGQLLGGALPATLTVAFGSLKPAHMLLPGKAWCGEVIAVDIGISPDILYPLASAWRNTPALWHNALPVPTPWQHKYERGHSLIIAGTELIGATRLMAMASARSGSGLVTVHCPAGNSLSLLQTTLPAAMLVRSSEGVTGIIETINAHKVTASAFGPGAGTGYRTKQILEALRDKPTPLVLDADALTTLAASRDDFLGKFAGTVILTPHQGEFERLFPEITAPDKTVRALQAAEKSGNIVVYKGNDTVIAAPDGRLAINDNASSWLATAGSGDVLTGIITALLAGGMPPWEAACAAVWLHGEAGNRGSVGMIADDLPQWLPIVLQDLHYPQETGEEL